MNRPERNSGSSGRRRSRTAPNCRSVLVTRSRFRQSAPMAEDVEWEPWLLISDSGLWLGRTRDRWVVGREGGPVASAREDARALLPLLDREWSVAQIEIKEVEQRATELGPVPLTATVGLALRWRSDHWTTAALRWLRDGFPLTALEQDLAPLPDDGTLPQASRHLAAKILRTIRR